MCFVLVLLLVTVVDLLDSFKFALRYRGGLKLDPDRTAVPGELDRLLLVNQKLDRLLLVNQRSDGLLLVNQS